MNQEVKTKTDALVCYNHPDRETMLRCNRCDRPICTACAVLTPTGYRCKECVRGQLKVFDTAQWIDYPLAMIVAGVISAFGVIASFYMSFFTIFIAPVVGVILAEAVRWVVHRRRSRLLFQLAMLGAILGALVGIVFWTGLRISLFGVLWPGVFIFLVASTAYYRLSGIQIR